MGKERWRKRRDGERRQEGVLDDEGEEQAGV